MSNKEIAGYFSLLANLMELHEENPFKIRTYQFAYRTIRNHEKPLIECSREEIQALDGIGTAVTDKIHEIINTGELSVINEFVNKTPEGVIELLKLKGIGPKKIRAIWHELEIESPVELLYAVNENRLIELKGFGPKIQQNVKDQLEYLLESRDKYHFARVETLGLELYSALKVIIGEELLEFCGEYRRKCQELESIDFITTSKLNDEDIVKKLKNDDLSYEDDQIYFSHIPINIFRSSRTAFYYNLLKQSSAYNFFMKMGFKAAAAKSEEELFKAIEFPYVIPEMREEENLEREKSDFESVIIEEKDVKGVVHCHSNYSDGAATVEQMASAAKEKGYAYMVMTDHSKAAFYANGLEEERLMKQIEEIKTIDRSMSGFDLYSGIEADILSDGSLDYDEDTRSALDVIIASVHSNLNMDEEKANNRIIKAIENSQTHILGHPTGRLILSRKGYPVNHQKIIDACAANRVAIEINANPYRLDLDWRWVASAMEKGVLLSINPDAHSIKGIDDIHFGICAARKGGLRPEMCLNAKDSSDFISWIKEK